MNRTYAGAIIVLQIYFCKVTWQMARITPLFLPSLRKLYYDPELELPLLTRLACNIAPYSWLIPMGLMVLIATRWKKADDKAMRAGIFISMMIFMVYLGICLIGFAFTYINYKLTRFV